MNLQAFLGTLVLNIEAIHTACTVSAKIVDANQEERAVVMTIVVYILALCKSQRGHLMREFVVSVSMTMINIKQTTMINIKQTRMINIKQMTIINSQLVSRCFKPSQPQRITSGLNTNFTLSPSQSLHKSSYHKVMVFQPIYIPRALNTGTCIQQGNLFYSAGLHRNHVLATANAGKNRERFWRKCR